MSFFRLAKDCRQTAPMLLNTCIYGATTLSNSDCDCCQLAGQRLLLLPAAVGALLRSLLLPAARHPLQLPIVHCQA
jgi:hypothetical protein